MFYPELFYRAGEGYTKFNYYYNQIDVVKNHTYCLQLGYIHSSRKQLMCSGQLVYTSPLLVVCTARYLWLCTCTAHLALSSKCSMCSSTIAIACMQDHDILEPHPFSRSIARWGTAQPRFSENTVFQKMLYLALLRSMDYRERQQSLFIPVSGLQS